MVDDNGNDITSEQIKEERKYYLEKIRSLEKELKDNEEEFRLYDFDRNELLQQIERFKSLTVEDLKNSIRFKQKCMEDNYELRKYVAEEIEKEKKLLSNPQEGELFSQFDLHPESVLENKKTGLRIKIRQSGNMVHNVKVLAGLKNLQEAGSVVKKITDAGFEIKSTESRIVVYNDETFYDFYPYSIDYSIWSLNEYDFKAFIKNNCRPTKKMKSYALQILEKNRQNHIQVSDMTLEDVIKEVGPRSYREGMAKLAYIMPRLTENEKNRFMELCKKNRCRDKVSTKRFLENLFEGKVDLNIDKKKQYEHLLS